VYLALHFAKLVAVALLFTGSIGAVFAKDYADRRRFAYALAGPGFGLSWILGFVLAGTVPFSLLSTWILCGLGLSFFSLQVVLYAVGKDGRRTPLTATLILAPLVATLALMVFKPG
jgi:membrane protease YdiL (CAAX protease family)